MIVTRPDRLAWARPVAAPVALAVVTVAAATATRLVDGWEDGRLWALDVLLVAVGLLSGARGVARGVAAAGEGRRAGERVPTLVARGGAVLLASAALLGVGVRGGVDWHDLDVPAAWGRLDLGIEVGRVRPAPPEVPDTEPAEASEGGGGECYSGNELDPDDEVPCTEPHRLEVLATVALDGPDGFPDRDDLSAQARDRCAGVEHAELEPGMAVGTDVPDRDEWTGGRRTAACVVRVAGEPVTGSVAVPR